MIRKEIRSGLEHIAVPSPTLPPATTTNAWILQEHTIVDPAASSKKNKEELLSLLIQKPPKRIFLTHHHNDHVASATYIQEKLDIPIVCSAITAKQLSFSVDAFCSDGQILSDIQEEWRIYETPGHAKGHLCLYSQEYGDIIAGDMVAGEGTILLIPGDGDFGDYITQLKRLKNLQPKRLFPAHGPIIHHAQKYLQHYIDHRSTRLEQILQQLDAKPRTPTMLAEKIYTEVPKAVLPIAAKQILCHLLHLEKTRKAIQLTDGWTASQL